MSSDIGHATLIGHLFSPEQIDTLYTRLSELEENGGIWCQHVNKRAFEGVWDVVALRCLSEHADSHPIMQNFSHHNTNDLWQNLPLLDSFPEIHEIIHTFTQSCGLSVKSVRFMRLHAGASILPHRDAGLGLAFGEARLHIPITSDPDVEFYVADNKVPMEKGQLWYIDADKTHWVNNKSQHSRTHLVIDCHCDVSTFKQLQQHFHCLDVKSLDLKGLDVENLDTKSVYVK